MKKLVLKLDLQDDKEQQRRALKTVSILAGIDEIMIDLKGKKLTIIGTVDPITVVSKLRKKNWSADIISCGPKEEPKKEEPKKEEAKKEEEPKKEEAKKEEEPKKEEAKKEEEPKKEEAKKEQKKIEPEVMALGTAPGFHYIPPPPHYYYHPPNPPINRYYYVNHSVEDNPNGCVIC